MATKTGTKTKTKTKPAFRIATSNKPQSSPRGELRKIGALWISEGKNGKFFSGRIQLSEDEEIRILVFKNGYKEEPKHPDYVIYEPGQAENKRSEINDDDIPF